MRESKRSSRTKASQQLLTPRLLGLPELRFSDTTGQMNEGENSDRIDAVLRRVGMPTKGHKMPHQLSGGEQQRVSIARALLNDPPLILADEPTGNLDPHMSEELMHLLEEIRASGRSILMATHDYALLLKFPHATYRCANGTLASTVQKTL